VAKHRLTLWEDLSPELRASALRRIRSVERAAFFRNPVLAIAKYLESFTSRGRFARDVPKVVMEALAVHFARFMRGDSESLDAAFGRKTATLRNKITTEERDYGVVFDVISHMRTERERRAKERQLATRKGRPRPRFKSTPFEIAVEFAAKRHKLDEENVRRIYKKSGSR
jgi:hypothetical protein